MKFLLSPIVLLCSACLVFADPKIEVYFSPKGGCTEAVVENLNKATSSVLVQAYSFTSAPIARALVDAKRRGLQIQVLLDKSQRTGRYSEGDFLQHNAIPTYIDAEHAIAHSKIMIIDNQTVITGSFNFSKQAEQENAENLLVIRDPGLAAKYAVNWREHFKHSTAYTRKAGATHSAK